MTWLHVHTQGFVHAAGRENLYSVRYVSTCGVKHLLFTLPSRRARRNNTARGILSRQRILLCLPFFTYGLRAEFVKRMIKSSMRTLKRWL